MAQVQRGQGKQWCPGEARQVVTQGEALLPKVGESGAVGKHFLGYITPCHRDSGHAPDC